MAQQILTFYGVAVNETARIRVTKDDALLYLGEVPVDPMGTELFTHTIDGEIPDNFDINITIESGQTVMISAFSDRAPRQLTTIYSAENWEVLKKHYGTEDDFIECIMLYNSKSLVGADQEAIDVLYEQDYLNQAHHRAYQQVLLKHGLAWYPSTNPNLCWFVTV